MARPQFSEVQFGFDVRTNSPIDRRLVLTKEEMESMKMFNNCGKEINIAAVFPDDYFVLCEDNGRLYRYSRKADKECCDCEIDGNKNEWPFGTSNGHFRLFNDVIDIVANKTPEADAPTWESIVDKCGIAKVCTAEEAKAIRTEMARRFANLDAVFAEKADKTEVEALNDEVERLDREKQKNVIIFGSGDVVNSEGLPQPAKGYASYGVHVSYNKTDKSGNILGPKPTGFEGDMILIDHDPVVPAGGWVSEYDFGGVAKGQRFPAGTSLFDVIRQMLEGDPRIDDVICCQVVNELPRYWKEIGWAQFTYQRYQLWRYEEGEPVESGVSMPFDEWLPKPNNQYIILAIPRAMLEYGCNNPSPDNPYGPVDGYMNHTIRLDWVANPEQPEYKYEFNYYDIPNKEHDADWGYRVYYLSKATGTLPLEWAFKYTYDYETDQPHKGYPVNP